MQYLVDTGVLLRAFERTSLEQKNILRLFSILNQNNHSFVASHQNMSEFWNVATRPKSSRGGFGLDVNEVEKRVSLIENLVSLLEFNQACYVLWKQLIMKYQVTGVSVHDAKLVSLMEYYAVKKIITLNKNDFRRYENITAYHPSDLI